MATFVAGGVDTYHAAAYGRAHPGTIAYLERSRDRMKSKLNDHGLGLMEASEKLYRRYDDSAVVRLARAATRKVSNLWRPDGISVLSDIGQFQHANYDMVRWNMANPVARRMWMDQECQGYGDKYYDNDPKRVGVQHYDYRRATNHMWLEIDDDREEATSWDEELIEGDVELHFEEKADIAETWRMLNTYLAKKGGDDPTDPYNSSL